MIFFLRRYVLIFCLLVIPNWVNLICILHFLSSMVITYFVIKVKPYKTLAKNRQEQMNEVTILLCVYVMLMFTDFIYQFVADCGDDDTLVY